MANLPRWWTKDTVALVTGSSKGIGLEIVRGFAKQGITTILTARNEARGLKAVKLLEDEGVEVVFHQLDVANPESGKEIVAWVEAKFGGLDILVNNAAVGPDSSSDRLNVERATATLQINYYGAKRMVESLLPILRPGARIVNISSAAGQLALLRGGVAAHWSKVLSDVDKLSEQIIDDFIQNFLDDLSKGEHVKQGWPVVPVPNLPEYPQDDIADYCVSKAALNAYTRMLAREFSSRAEGEKIYANCMCPGHTATDMTFNSGHSPEVGADTAVWLALLHPSQCPSGEFFVRRTKVGFQNIPLAVYDKFVENLDEVYEDFESIATGRLKNKKELRV